MSGDVIVTVTLNAALHVAYEVLDVAEALHLGEARDGDASRTGHSAEVVASQVDQHHVLGTLLAVGQQVGRQLVVVGVGRAARARAGDRVSQEVAVLHA